MLMVGDKMGIDTIFLQYLRHGVIKGFQRAPTPVKKIQSACMQFTSCRHTRQAPYIGIVKGYTFLPQTPEVRHFSQLISVVGKEMTVQGIVHHHNCFHNSVSSQFFIPDDTIPCTKYFCAQAYTITIGITVMMVAAIR